MGSTCFGYGTRSKGTISLGNRGQSKTRVQAKVVLWGDIKENPSNELKVSQIALIPHKSRAFCAILDLSPSIGLASGYDVLLVNESSAKSAPSGAINQLGTLIDVSHTHLCAG